MSSLALPAPKRGSILPYLGVAVVAAAILGPGAALAGTDTSFNTALTQFTNFLSGSGGKVRWCRFSGQGDKLSLT